MNPIVKTRNRYWLSIGIVSVIMLGLASRKFPSVLPAFLGKYPGDALWALMVFLGWGLFKPRALTWVLAALALATSSLVEFSQLYQVPWLNAIRGTPVGHLVLGFTFSWADLVAYVIGIFIGVLIDVLLLHGVDPASAAQP